MTPADGTTTWGLTTDANLRDLARALARSGFPAGKTLVAWHPRDAHATDVLVVRGDQAAFTQLDPRVADFLLAGEASLTTLADALVGSAAS